MKTVPNSTGTRQLRPVYYEPDHGCDLDDTITAALALRGYQVSFDQSLLDEPGLAVLRDGSGVLHITDGTRTEPLAEVEEHASAAQYADAIADWFDTDTTESPEQDLLRAVLEALTIPSPKTLGDSDAHYALVTARANYARFAIESALKDGFGFPVEAKALRQMTAKNRVTYKTWGGAR